MESFSIQMHCIIQIHYELITLLKIDYFFIEKPRFYREFLFRKCFTDYVFTETCLRYRSFREFFSAFKFKKLIGTFLRIDILLKAYLVSHQYHIYYPRHQIVYLKGRMTRKSRFGTFQFIEYGPNRIPMSALHAQENLCCH